MCGKKKKGRSKLDELYRVDGRCKEQFRRVTTRFVLYCCTKNMSAANIYPREELFFYVEKKKAHALQKYLYKDDG